MKRSCLSLLFFACLALLSCSNNSSTSVTYDVTDATVNSFALAAQDSFPGLGVAVFTVDNRLDTGLIAPRDGDSLLYGTPLTQVVPRVTFNSRPSAAIYYTGDTSFVYTGYDTIDLTRQPVYLRVYAANRTDEKYYRIEAYAHSIDPYLYRIDTLAAEVVSPACTMHALCRDGGFYAFLSDGYTLLLTRSADGSEWDGAQTVTGLPQNATVRQIVMDSVSSSFYYLSGTSLYRSSDGLAWTESPLPFPVTPFAADATLAAFAGRIWFVASAGEDTYLACYDPQTEQTDVLQTVPADFPVSDFATVVFRSVSGSATALVEGGFDREGRMSDDCWSLEEAGGGFRLLNLGTSRYPRPAMAGATLVSYTGRLVRFGGLTADGSIEGVYESESEGLVFEAADTAHLPVPEGFTPRYRQSAVVRGDCIYLFGGQDHSRYYSDVYRIRLNSIGWK